MPDYEVKFSGHITIEADSLSEAKDKFNTEKNKICQQTEINDLQPEHFYDTEEEAGVDVLGMCEICELPITEGQENGYDQDGVMWHTECEEIDNEITSVYDPDR